MDCHISSDLVQPIYRLCMPELAYGHPSYNISFRIMQEGKNQPAGVAAYKQALRNAQARHDRDSCEFGCR